MSEAPTEKLELVAYEDANQMEPATLACELREHLGARLVAFIAGVKETRAVHEWAKNGRKMNQGAEQRLRLAYRVYRLVSSRDNDRVAQAWFQGLNPKLDDRSPARLLRDGDLEEVGPYVLAAARAFAAIG